MSATTFEVAVATHGPVGAGMAAYAEERIRRACALSPAPVHDARIALTDDRKPTVERPWTAKVALDVDGRLVRAHVAAASPAAAVDALEARLRTQLTALAGGWEVRRREPTNDSAAGRRDGSRPEFVRRPAGGRRLVRRKAYALRALTPEEAAREMQLLDHDFHLFTDLVSAEEAVVFRQRDGDLGVQFLEGSIRAIVPPPFVATAPATTMTLARAVAELDARDARFVFFRDAASGRGEVVYRRYDGHYGLVVPVT